MVLQMRVIQFANSIKNKIVDDMLKELDGKYYELMYGKKKAQTIKEEQN